MNTPHKLILTMFAAALLCAPCAAGELDALSGESDELDANIRCWRRECEFLLSRAEALCSITSALGRAYPKRELDESRHALASTGTLTPSYGGDAGAPDACSSDGREHVIGRLQQVFSDAMCFLEARIATKGVGIPVLVFNPCSWTRTDAVTVRNPFPGESAHVKVTDPLGRVRAARAMGDSLQFTARDVPALGYKVFWINRTAEPVGGSVRADGATLENEFFRVTVDPDLCAIRSIHDKRAKTEIVPADALFGSLRILRKTHRGEPAGRAEEFESRHDIIGPTDAIVVNSGPARATVSMDSEYGESQFVQEVTLYDGVPRIDLRVTADWQEPSERDQPSSELTCRFETGLDDAIWAFETPLGAVERSADGRRIPAHNWMDLSSPHRGISVLNDCAHEFSAEGSVMQAALIRSSRESPKRGVHETTLSIYPHTGGWRAANTVRRGVDLNQPLAARVVAAHDGELPASMSYVSISRPDVVAVALRQAPQDSALILRLRETHGAPCRTNVRLNLPVAAWVRTDAAEQPLGVPQPVKDGVFAVDLGEYETVTIRLLGP